MPKQFSEDTSLILNKAEITLASVIYLFSLKYFWGKPDSKTIVLFRLAYKYQCFSNFIAFEWHNCK